MKLLKFSFFLSLILSIAACSSDDVYICTQSDWVGTYTGTVDCDGTIEDVTVTITADGLEDLIIKYETDNTSKNFDELTPNGCSINRSEMPGTLTFTVEASLDGDDLLFKDIVSANGNAITCSITATRD